MKGRVAKQHAQLLFGNAFSVKIRDFASSPSGRVKGEALDEADDLAGEDHGEQGIENAPEGNIG